MLSAPSHSFLYLVIGKIMKSILVAKNLKYLECFNGKFQSCIGHLNRTVIVQVSLEWNIPKASGKSEVSCACSLLSCIENTFT